MWPGECSGGEGGGGGLLPIYSQYLFLSTRYTVQACSVHHSKQTSHLYVSKGAMRTRYAQTVHPQSCISPPAPPPLAPSALKTAVDPVAANSTISTTSVTLAAIPLIALLLTTITTTVATTTTTPRTTTPPHPTTPTTHHPSHHRHRYHNHHHHLLLLLLPLTCTLFRSFRLLYWVYWKRLSWIASIGGRRHTSIFLEALRKSLHREQYPCTAQERRQNTTTGTETKKRLAKVKTTQGTTYPRDDLS